MIFCPRPLHAIVENIINNLIKEICYLAKCHEKDICLDQCVFAGKVGWRASIEIGGRVIIETTLYPSDEEALKALLSYNLKDKI